MLTKLKGLSTRAKAALGSGLALLVAAGVGLGVWQPWNQQPEPEDKTDAPPQQVTTPQEPKEDKGLRLKVGSQQVPCTLYEGDGWSIYVPDGWTVTGGPDGVSMSDGTSKLDVVRGGQPAYEGAFVCAWAGGNGTKARTFYAGVGGSESWTAAFGPFDQEIWDRDEKLATALTRTLKAGSEEIFADSFVLPSEPDWQMLEGMTVLFLDKDGYIVDERIQTAVEDYMLSWTDETKAAFTGQYRVNGISWAYTFTGIADGYIDVFRADVSYETAEGAAAESLLGRPMEIRDGWAQPKDGVLLALYHDGGSVEKTKWLDEGTVRSLPELAAMLKA